MRPFLATLTLFSALACSTPSAPPPATAERPASATSAPAPTGTALENETPKKGCACQLKLKPPPTSPPAATPSPVASELPTPPFDFERRSACTAPVCRLDGWLPDPAFADTTREGVPSTGAVWLETLAAESTLVLPSSAELESLALVLEGRIAYGEGESAKAPSAPVLSAWSALRAPSAGYSLRARDEKASVLVVVLSRSGTLAQAIARGRQKNASKSEKARLEVADLAASPTLRWGNGTNVARIAFGAKAGAERGASLSLLQVSGRGQLPETVHPAEWEHIAIVRGSGDLVLGNARYPVNPGAVFHVPRGTIHGFQGSGEDLAAITVFSPAGPEQRYVEAAAKERPQP